MSPSGRPAPRHLSPLPVGRRPVTARSVALDALARIDEGGFANLILAPLLERSGLAGRDRAFATELTYGTTRMRRACDWLIDRHLRGDIEPHVRALLRLGAYQLAMLGVAPHAAVSATVDESPPRVRGLINAVLRKVAGELPARWPDVATRLSYPDWIVARLGRDLGPDLAEAALAAMNEAPPVTVRSDGYVQDRASQWVAAAVGVEPGDAVADLCAAPGGKATAMAADGAAVVAALDLHPHRAGLVQANARSYGYGAVAPIVADATRSPLRAASFDRVLVDAPCSGLGVLRRRPDARWRVQEADIDRLVGLQRALLDAAADLARPGGSIVYSVCTLTTAETSDIDRWLTEAHPDLKAVAPPGSPWTPVGRGARLLPQTAGTDGMYVLRLRRR